MTRWVFLLLGFTTLASAWDYALPGYRYEFPKDHFSHPTFKTEWWYYTGNLKTVEGRRFGFELTFFRQAVAQEPRAKPDSTPGPESHGKSPWELDNLYLAHLTLSDLNGQQFFQEDRLNRSGPGLAGSDATTGRIWNGNWEVRFDLPDELGRQRLRAVARDFELQLQLTPTKPPIVHGRDGVSEKSQGRGRASHYITFTRLSVSGFVTLRQQTHAVTGEAWMDHEFSTDSLGPGQVGWDWMSIQLEDNTELMLYRMRRADGTADPYSSGTYVDAAGHSRHLTWTDIRMAPGELAWTSPSTGGKYPLSWQIEVIQLGLSLECHTILDGQEVVAEAGGPSYWEGAVQYEGMKADKNIKGSGYLEMTGYDKPLTVGLAERSR